MARTRSRTLRGRVSALGLGVVAAWLVALTVAFNVVLIQRSWNDLDSRLHVRAVAAAATTSLDAAGQLRIREQNGDGALDTGVWVYARDRAVERAPAARNVQAEADRLASARAGYVNGTASLRFLVYPISRSGQRVGTVVTALSTIPYRRTRDVVLVGSTLVALLALLGAYLALRFAAARALRPVDRMTRQADAWSAAALTERFGDDQRFEELQSLAGTLNHVLDRQTASVRHERRVFAELSHELRTPLSRIVAETDLLLARPHDQDRLRLAHQNIHDTATAMNRILETLLTTARADNMSAVVSCRLLDAVTDLLDQRARTSTAQRDANVILEIPTDLLIGAESPLVERVLAPIIDNAQRFATSAVTIAGRRAGDAVLVEVSDDGPGVPATSAKDIFEPGVQLSPRPDHGGAGLGLALARRLARAAGGDVTFAGGATFEVRLPPG